MPNTQGISRSPSKTSNEMDVGSPEKKDIEAGRDVSAENIGQINPRAGIPPWKWYLSLLGLYLGALLYGMHLCHIERSFLSVVQGWTLP
jgi:hypothetical protein